MRRGWSGYVAKSLCTISSGGRAKGRGDAEVGHYLGVYDKARKHVFVYECQLALGWRLESDRIPSTA